MPGAGFIGAGPARHLRRAEEHGAKTITATVLPASSPLIVGETLRDTVNWSVFTAPANYATATPGEMIAGVQVNYTGDTASATEPLADGAMNAFSVTVTDTAGTARTFSTVPRTVVHSPPLVSGILADQNLTGATGLQSYDASGAFSGEDLGFALTGPAGVTIDGGTGVIRFDTEVLAVQSGTLITVTATNSGGTVGTGFALSVQAPVFYSAAINGLTNNPTHGPTAQIGVPLTGTIANLLGSETIQHRWTDTSVVIAGADTASFTPQPAQDLAQLRYAPLVNGEEVASPARSVRYAPPVAGSLTPVIAEQGSGAVQVNLAAGFIGDALIYAKTVSWASIAGSTLTVDDVVRSEAVTITATNSGGTASLDLNVTISAPVTAVVSPIADQSFQRNSGERTFDLRTVFENATNYSVSGIGASIDPDGYTLRLSDASLLTNETINITGSNIYNSAQDVFTLSVTEIPVVNVIITGLDSSGRALIGTTITATTDPGGAFSIEWSLVASGNNDLGTSTSLDVPNSAVNRTIHYRATKDGQVVNGSIQTYTEDFIISIETTSPGESVTLPWRNTGTYNADVDFGDGNTAAGIVTHNDAAWTNIYATAGTHYVRVSGQAGAPLFAGSPAAAKLRTVENIGALGWAFNWLSALRGTAATSIKAGNANLSGVGILDGAFASNAAMTTLDLRGANLSPTNMRVMCNDCDVLDTVLGFGEIDTSNVTRADECFNTAPAMDFAQLDLSSWNLESLSASGGLFNFLPDSSALSQSVYDAWLIALDAQMLTSGIFLGLGQTPYTTGGAAEAARARLVNKGVNIEDAGNAPPEQMAAPALSVVSSSQIDVTFGSDPFTNGLPIQTRDIRYSTDELTWTQINPATSPDSITGLNASTLYHVQTRANNFNGDGAWSASAIATTQAGAQGFTATRSGSDLVLSGVPDVSPQTFTAEVAGSNLVITFTGTIYAPAPTQIALIDAANHDGTDPDAGNYTVMVFDLGSGANHVYTLSGVSVPAGTMAVLLHPETDVVGGGFEEFERVVFVGASIMEQTFGSSLSQRNPVAEAAFAAQGVAVEVYAHTASGFDAGQVQALLSEAMTAFPDRTLFFVHAGGNNVTANRPYPGGETALANDLNGLIDIAASRPGSVIISDLTFRDYGDTTAANETAGAKPYNDAIYLPMFQARQADLLSRAYYADGAPASCLYEWSYENRTGYLSSDNIHPANPAGRTLLRDWLAARLAPICLGLPVPAQFTRTAPPPAPAIDIFVEYGQRTAAGVNTPGVSVLAAGGQTSEGPFVLLNADGGDPGVSLTLNFSAPASGSNSGFGINTRGNGDGAAGFDGTLYNDIFTADSYYAGAAYTLDHVLSGLAANTAYTVELIASRDATDSRETRYDFANGESATIQTTADPTQAPVTVNTVSDGAGRITITQSAVSGSWSYLGGLHITTT